MPPIKRLGHDRATKPPDLAMRMRGLEPPRGSSAAWRDAREGGGKWRACREVLLSAAGFAAFSPSGFSDVLPSSCRRGLRYVSGVGRNVLVISTVEHADDVLRGHVGDVETIKVVVPVVRQGALDWLANDQKAFGHAERIAERTAEQLSGETVDATAGEADVGLAIRDALATFPADEIVVAVRPHEQEGLVESHATETAPQHRIEGVPVRYVVISD
jgi:hypothetical protein